MVYNNRLLTRTETMVY